MARLVRMRLAASLIISLVGMGVACDTARSQEGKAAKRRKPPMNPAVKAPAEAPAADPAPKPAAENDVAQRLTGRWVGVSYEVNGQSARKFGRNQYAILDLRKKSERFEFFLSPNCKGNWLRPEIPLPDLRGLGLSSKDLEEMERDRAKWASEPIWIADYDKDLDLIRFYDLELTDDETTQRRSMFYGRFVGKELRWQWIMSEEAIKNPKLAFSSKEGIVILFKKAE